MQFFTDVFQQLFGQDATAANVVASFIMFAIGAAVVFAIEISKRNPASDRTPLKFNFWFLIQDNWSRIFYTILIGSVVIMAGANLTMLIGFTMPESLGRFMPLIAGLSSDAIALAIKRKFTSKNGSTD